MPRPSPFTIAMPAPLPAERAGEHWWLDTDGRRVRLSNLDKVFWRDEGYTKGDLLAHYWNVASTIGPYLRDRPLTMKRMPDGAGGPHFYEKNAPSHTPDWVERCLVRSEDASGGEIDFLMANDTASLLYVANLGCIEMHPLHSRCGTTSLPDYLFFDLDPFEPATFADVLAVASHVHAALDALGLPSYPKTSGATGVQIYVPIEHGPTYQEVRDLVGVVGRAIRAADPDRVTMEWEISKRSGKVFIDHNMNRQGANIAAVYSVRPEPGATVSTPLTWDEVAQGAVRPGDFTIATIHDRLATVGDLFRGVLDEPVDIRGALERMGVRRDDGPHPPATSESARSLDEYTRKRRFDLTPEPGPASAAPTEGLPTFVVQKHNATRLHYDLRLERDGVLVSWAVPKGLPTEPGPRHLAVQTEDHPLEYGGFEGWIPQGEYGGGEVRIFDRGTYEALEWTADKVSVRLHGERLSGEYHIVKTSRDWLVLRAKAAGVLDVEPPVGLLPMLAEGGYEPFDHPGWRFEPKLDGIRTLAHVSPDRTHLVSRTGKDQTARYPELSDLAKYVNALRAVLDGEIVGLGEGGIPSFEALQQRMNLASDADIERARRQVPVQLYLFDVLWLDGEDLTPLPLEERRRRLEDIVTADGPVQLTFHTDGAGHAVFEASKELGLEGALAKRLGSPYQPGRRSKDWRKIKATRRMDCVVVGWTPGTGGRTSSFGSLLLAARDGEDLRWVGQVGTGFTDPMLADIRERLEALETDRPPVADPELRTVKGARWTRPELVCEVEYLEQTAGGKLRAPSFKGFRPDAPRSDRHAPGSRS